ncbi:MAG TPA: hypothetical protein DCZ94_11730 [Lentisphaeria bacterium]|nr:MAG: permease [Lentisphaerae bacterium GWF2_49_21]HBC87617.1 hypothetical protein [Lentisphaeria bacterium]
MNWKNEWKPLLLILAVFLACFYAIGTAEFDNGVFKGLYLVRWYAREHVIFCLIPAFFIAGAISVFINQASVMKYLGANANKYIAYGTASISGSVLAVCSCTVLPIFAGIYKMGAGLGPATAFLYSGPAINIMAIILTARVLGFELGVARAVGAVVFSVIIGLLMHFIFRKEEKAKCEQQLKMPVPEVKRPLWQNALFFASLAGILVFANWGKSDSPSAIWNTIYSYKFAVASFLAVSMAVMLYLWFGMKWQRLVLAAVPILMFWPLEPMLVFAIGIIAFSIITSTDKGESGTWFWSSWGFTKQILPLLLAGVFVSGFLFGQPGSTGIIPAKWITESVGGNSLLSNLVASVIGVFMYFATLTEIPILQGLMANGMGKGPALALLLAGPALSLPSMLVLNSIMGIKKTVVYILLVIMMSTVTGLAYGMMP